MLIKWPRISYKIKVQNSIEGVGGQNESGGAKQLIGHVLMLALFKKTYGYLTIIFRFPWY